MRTGVYIAAAYGRREEMRAAAERIERLGLAVTARWVWGDHSVVEDESSVDQMRRWAEEDLQDIRRSRIVLVVTESARDLWFSGGRHVEFGYAVALGKRVMVVGDPENIFHHLGAVCPVPSMEVAIRCLTWHALYQCGTNTCDVASVPVGGLG